MTEAIDRIRADNRRRGVQRGILVVFGLATALLLIPSCGDRRELGVRMTDDDPAVRIRAMREAVDRERRDLLPSLVDRLEDDDPAVRLFAIVALERMTGQRFAYRPESDRSERQAAVAAWRMYLKENDQRRGQAESSGGTGASNARHAKNSAP